jgi:hypothetical protein
VINHDGQFNCFVSVVLQALWHSDIFRSALAKFNESSFNPKFKEHHFIASLQAFFQQTENENRQERNLNVNQLRVELYKLYYYDTLFDLNMKGDSAELLAAILKLIHGCFIDPTARITAATLED